MDREIHVKGLANLTKFLDELPANIEKNILRGALRAGMSTVLPVAQQRIHNISGLLAGGLKIGTNARGSVVMATIKTTGPHGYLGAWVEFGTRVHTITAKNGGALAFGGGLHKSVVHPGAKPHPFLRPALDGQAEAALNAAAQYMRARLEKKGVDTSGIDVGVDS